MADTETIGYDSLEEYLSAPAESSSDVQVAEGSLPQDDPLQDEQSPETQEEVAPDPVDEEPAETETPDDDVTPDAPASPDEPAAPTVNWDSEENPHFKAAKQFEEVQRLAAEQRAQKEQEAQDERYKKAIKGFVEVDEDDIDALAGDFIEEIRSNAIKPFQGQIDELTHSFQALVAAVRELPPEQVARLKERSQFWGKIGDTPEAIESAFTVRTAAQQEADKRYADLERKYKALKGQQAKQAAKETGADRADVANVAAAGQANAAPLTLEDYLRGADDDGRTLRDPYGMARRTG